MDLHKDEMTMLHFDSHPDLSWVFQGTEGDDGWGAVRVIN